MKYLLVYDKKLCLSSSVNTLSEYFKNVLCVYFVKQFNEFVRTLMNTFCADYVIYSLLGHY